ncbi:predicted protein [Streptomyces sp. AA4]|nr:predicted protein [Streptomyces sp. AA4]
MLHRTPTRTGPARPPRHRHRSRSPGNAAITHSDNIVHVIDLVGRVRENGTAADYREGAR